MKSRFFITCLALAWIPSAYAALVITTDSVAIDIPDASSAGLARNISVLTVTGRTETVTSVVVSVEITASPGQDAFLGDLYLFLTNGTHTAILLNRAGRSLTAPGGYGDNQTMDVTFTNLAINDIHTYRDVLTGSATTPLVSPLTGTWLPDGRPIDPANVLTTDLSSAGLDTFVGDAADGDWSLFVADMSGGGEHRLVSWTLTVNTVPEPSALLLTLGAVPLLLRRRR
jgi:subtilisin-like proprotein convertase family protein